MYSVLDLSTVPRRSEDRFVMFRFLACIASWGGRACVTTQDGIWLSATHPDLTTTHNQSPMSCLPNIYSLHFVVITHVTTSQLWRFVPALYFHTKLWKAIDAHIWSFALSDVFWIKAQGFLCILQSIHGLIHLPKNFTAGSWCWKKLQGFFKSPAYT